jgi:SPP1 gp7 family putative phage head morphogenesis protein
MFKFADAYIEAIIKGIYDGSITEYDLPDNLYYAIADHLKSAVYKGFGASIEDLSLDTMDLELLTELRENVYIFSAAKTFQQVSDMCDALTDGDKIRPFAEFKDMARDIFDTYNDTWLKTEYHTAVGQAQNASKWNRIEKQKDVLPLLKYSAIEDANTSEICAPLDGICLPVDDPFWDEFMPLNHFNCRCLVEQIAEGEENVSSKGEVENASETAGDDMQDMFKMNAGKDRVIFSDEHPYFDVSKGDKAFARENFGLDIPDED